MITSVAPILLFTYLYRSECLTYSEWTTFCFLCVMVQRWVREGKVRM